MSFLRNATAVFYRSGLFLPVAKLNLFEFLALDEHSIYHFNHFGRHRTDCLASIVHFVSEKSPENKQKQIITIMSTTQKQFYEPPTSEIVEVATNSVLCQSLDGVQFTRSGYSDEGDKTWSGEDY